MQMQNIKFNWIKCGDNPFAWCDFLNVDLAHDTSKIYMVFM